MKIKRFRNEKYRKQSLKGEMILESAVNKGVSVVLTFKMRDAIKIILVDDEVL
jgi:predicted Fe-Mo cluster-binding NifX family protein